MDSIMIVAFVIAAVLMFGGMHFDNRASGESSSRQYKAPLKR